MALRKEDNASGTSFTNHVILASVNQLIKALGAPMYEDRDEDEKSQIEWDFVIEDEGSVFTIYDWKEYRIYDNDEIIEWHIGGFSPYEKDYGHTDMDKVKEELGKLGLVVR